MKMSRRARRMEKSHKKHRTPPLNLVALMDIFTILVFFLLVSSSNSYQLPSHTELSLPKSSSNNVPEETLVIAITREQVLLEGKPIAAITEVISSEEESIVRLKDELALAGSAATDNPLGKKITIMSDENVPYEVIRKVLSSCQQSHYTRIAFAAMQQEKPAG